MSSLITFQDLPILIDGYDTQGQLVLFEGQLVAVVVRLDHEVHEDGVKGSWHLEAGFGPCEEIGGRVFQTLDQAEAWASERIEAKRRASVR